MRDYQNIVWNGWQRKDGRKGIRNKLVIVYTVKCSFHVASEIARQSKDVDVDVIGFDGCYDNDYANRLLVALIRHPNVGAVFAVGLGCEYLQPEKLAEKAREAGKLADWMFIQEHNGTLPSIEYGLKKVENLKKELKKMPLTQMGFKDLVIGAECGGSDYTSGLAGNVLVGRFFDRLVDLGGTAVFEEIVEAVGLRDYLTGRAVDETARRELGETYDKAMEYCKAVRQYSVSPGNFAGGLSSIEEKSMGAIAKSGTRLIQGVLKVSMPVPYPGLWLLDSTPDPHWMMFGYTNPNDTEGLLDLISVGAQLVFLVTGRGNVIGSVISPVYKITGNSQTYRNMCGDMDFDAGIVLTGEKNLEEACSSMMDELIEICGGTLTKGEATGHKEFYSMYKYQEPAPPRCRFQERG